MVKNPKKYFTFWNPFLGILWAGILAVNSAVWAQPAHVVLVRSTPRAEYEQTAGVIISSLEKNNSELAVEEINFNDDPGQEDEFWQKALEKRPELVITIGSPATKSAVKYVHNVPIIFTMVLDNLSGLISTPSSSISGVTLAIPVQEQLEIIRNALPDIKRVGFLYSSQSAQMYQSAIRVADKMGLRLVTSEIASERDVPEALRRIIREADVFWMPPDAIIYERNILRFILLECFQNNVPIIAVSKHIAEAGTPLALDIDYEDIGRQTAELVLKSLSNRSSAKPAIEHPRKVLLYINEWVISRLGLKIPQQVIEQAIPVSGR